MCRRFDSAPNHFPSRPRLGGVCSFTALPRRSGHTASPGTARRQQANQPPSVVSLCHGNQVPPMRCLDGKSSVVVYLLRVQFSSGQRKTRRGPSAVRGSGPSQIRIPHAAPEPQRPLVHPRRKTHGLRCSDGSHGGGWRHGLDGLLDCGLTHTGSLL